MAHGLEYLIIAVYLLLLLGLGSLAARMTRTVDDYVRGAGQGTWWLVGTSAFMSSFSAYTFTANGGLAYEGGPSPLVIFFAISCGLVLAALFMGPWLRQTRALTWFDIVRERFGPEVEQFSVIIGLLKFPLQAAIQLWALCSFCATVFGLSLQGTIVVVGLVVVAYSSKGGRWAVMASDFLQGLILVPTTLLIAILCLRAVGGPAGFLDLLSTPGLDYDFRLIKDPGQFASGKYAWKWLLAMFCISFFNEISFYQAPKYLSVKDGREARWSALLSLVLISLGGLVFLFPAMTSRLLYPDMVASVPLSNPAEAAYAIAALQVLPNGLVGILVVAMFAATMSSMDVGLNMTTGGIIKNLLPAISFGLKPESWTDATRVHACQFINIGLGLLVIVLALAMARKPDLDIFGAFMIFQSVLSVPMTLPFTLSLFIRRLPRWSYFFMFACGLLPTAFEMVAGRSLPFPDKILAVFGLIFAGALISRPFYATSSSAFRQRTSALFARMRTPIDLATEVPPSRDLHQLRLLGATSLVAGGLLLLLLLVPNSFGGRLSVVFIAGFVAGFGALLLRASRPCPSPPSPTSA